LGGYAWDKRCQRVGLRWDWENKALQRMRFGKMEEFEKKNGLGNKI